MGFLPLYNSYVLVKKDLVIGIIIFYYTTVALCAFPVERNVD